MKRLVSCLFVVVAISCCETEPVPEGIALELEETSCANAWGASSEISAITEYLQSEGIHPIAVNRTRTAPPDMFFCEACICANGWTVFIVVKPEDEEKARELGFH